MGKGVTVVSLEKITADKGDGYKIVDTNASYRDGSGITIMDMDFAEMLKANPKTMEETKSYWRAFPESKRKQKRRSQSVLNRLLKQIIYYSLTDNFN